MPLLPVLFDLLGLKAPVTWDDINAACDALSAGDAPRYGMVLPTTDEQNYVHQIFDAFGPKRTFWGTDISKMPCTWRQCVTMFTEEMPWLKGEDQRLVMGQAICDWWRWERDA